MGWLIAVTSAMTCVYRLGSGAFTAANLSADLETIRPAPHTPASR